jgi:hypothetical protein
MEHIDPNVKWTCNVPDCGSKGQGVQNLFEHLSGHPEITAELDGIGLIDLREPEDSFQSLGFER